VKTFYSLTGLALVQVHSCQLTLRCLMTSNLAACHGTLNERKGSQPSGQQGFKEIRNTERYV
jgi:hypothetical protein